MITSNIDEIQLKVLKAQQEQTQNSGEFKQTVLSSINNEVEDNTKTDALTYENIKGISLEQIERLFKDEDSKNMAKNLRFATLFTKDTFLGKAMFNTVLGQPFDTGYNYLFNRYEDKHNFLNPKGKTIADIIHDSINRQIDEGFKKPTDVISEDRLGEILTQINSYSFVDAFARTSKSQYDRYKDDDTYSSFYNNYALEYGQLLQRFEDMEKETNRIISQL